MIEIDISRKIEKWIILFLINVAYYFIYYNSFLFFNKYLTSKITFIW